MHYVNKENLAKEHKMQKSGKATGIDEVKEHILAGKGINHCLENIR